MGLKADAIDEIGETSRPLVEVPLPLSDRVAWVLAGVFSAGMVPMMVGVCLYVGGSIEPLFLAPLALFLCIVLLGSLVQLRRCLALASRPQFEIGKDGLRLRVGEDAHGLHYEWKEVSYCHWSHFEPGVLNIQVGANPAWSRVSLPPTRLFHRVPEAYRSRVERAIRAMGKWREGDSDPVPDQAVSRANDSTKVKAAAIDEIDGPPVPLVEIPRSRWKIIASLLPSLLFFAYVGLFVEIPRPRWKIVASLLPSLLFFAYVGLLVWANLHLDGAGAARHGSARLWFIGVFIGIATIVVPLTILAWARRPEFAVEKDGIRLPVERRPEWSSLWSLRDLGLFAWEEVSFCRWSRYEPGLLKIQAKATLSLGNFEQPPTRLEYRVPEPYRPSVERAIRAMGKWAD
jgi:hypothetical protein